MLVGYSIRRFCFLDAKGFWILVCLVLLGAERWRIVVIHTMLGAGLRDCNGRRRRERLTLGGPVVRRAAMVCGGDRPGGPLGRGGWRILSALFAVMMIGIAVCGAGAQNKIPPGSGSEHGATQSEGPSESELQKGIELTRRGQFAEAIPSLVKAREEAPGSYAAAFNLALCYVGVGDFKRAIGMLTELREGGHDSAAVNNLLAQSYIGDGELRQALDAVRAASKQTPKDEQMYAFVADACTDHYDYGLGLQVVDLGLQQLPGSARLHYERALFLARLDRLDEAKPEFEMVSKLSPGSDLAYLAMIQQSLYEGKIPEALSLAREGIKAGHRDYQMLSLLGTVLLHAGAAPGQPEFVEARKALEASVAAEPGYSTSQIALGKVYMMEGRQREAVEHLEIGRQLEPRNPSVYSNLAALYRQLGERTKAQERLAMLAELLKEKTAAAGSPQP